ncbi:hypothetical protein [Paenibacillus periandrae]|uniref:hypothetical protein n=1 Tax=Paenibacillus periandrae TaxID=1761741 RepID=UPI001F09CCAE|nr:hypothetical protein [Paenibacillus periandrae]
MEHFDYTKITANCLELALKDLTEALYLYEQEQYLLSEKRIFEAIYNASSVLHLIALERNEMASND